jgi:hypothetical protein
MTDAANQNCGGKDSHFNYCLFSKALVALPALSVVAFIPIMIIDTPVLQIAGAIGAVAGAIYTAMWLDRVPFLRTKFKARCAAKKLEQN